MKLIDLRSDTVTKPTDAMRSAMVAAEVGDDVYGEDPTVNRLQGRAGEIFEKEAALFVPTGSMGNGIAVKLHTKPGQEVVIEERGHILNYELGAAAMISGVTMRGVKSADGSGHLIWDEIEPALHVGQPYYAAPTGLICLENTHNFAGGSIMTAGHCAGICEKAHKIGLPVHMDGARIFNAAAALDDSVANLTRRCDSVMFALSKGLGAPAGSILLGSKDFIEEARTWRKRLGGGMRQIGILAAAGLIALEESPKRLHKDHENARKLAESLADIPGIEIDPKKVVTNIVIFDISGTGRTSGEICADLKESGILAIGFGNLIRMVTHCDVSPDDIAGTISVLESVTQPISSAFSDIRVGGKKVKKMNIEQLRQFCLAFAGATEDVKWSNDLCFSVGARMFCVTGVDSIDSGISLKCTPEKFAELTERDGIIPARYVARYHWVTIEKLDAMTTEELKALIENSYKLVREKLPKKLRDSIVSVERA